MIRFLIALQFLTRLPVRLQAMPDARQVGSSVLFYPLVGMGIGLLLAGISLVLPERTDLLGAALLLGVWVFITGALHLDGLADTADGWIGGQGDRGRTLAIMKDPYCGPAGVAAVVTVLLIKFAALAEILAHNGWLPLLLAPLLGRTLLPLLFATLPYVRPGGIATALANHLPRRSSLVVITGVWLLVVFGGGGAGLWALLAAAAAFILLRFCFQRVIGGTTGDTAGAMVELVETAVLAATAFYPSLII
jgi:adenosylcobinamide-GDP ribazoletransferase